MKPKGPTIFEIAFRTPAGEPAKLGYHELTLIRSIAAANNIGLWDDLTQRDGATHMRARFVPFGGGDMTTGTIAVQRAIRAIAAGLTLHVEYRAVDVQDTVRRSKTVVHL